MIDGTHRRIFGYPISIEDDQNVFVHAFLCWRVLALVGSDAVIFDAFGGLAGAGVEDGHRAAGRAGGLFDPGTVYLLLGHVEIAAVGLAEMLPDFGIQPGEGRGELL